MSVILDDKGMSKLSGNFYSKVNYSFKLDFPTGNTLLSVTFRPNNTVYNKDVCNLER